MAFRARRVTCKAILMFPPWSSAAPAVDTSFVYLQTVPGVQQRSAAKILAETGADMTQFPSQRNLSSWAGICPGNNRSAGKNRSNRWLRGALTESA